MVQKNVSFKGASGVFNILQQQTNIATPLDPQVVWLHGLDLQGINHLTRLAWQEPCL